MKKFKEIVEASKREMVACGDFETERDAILEAVRESLDKDIYVKLRMETAEGEKLKLSFTVTVDPEDKTVQAVMSGSLKLRQEGWSDWSGATGDLLAWAEEQANND